MDFEQPVTKANLDNAQIEPISIEKLREVVAQYARAEEERRKVERARLSQRHIVQCRMGLIPRGELAQRLLVFGYDGLEIAEILENEKL